MTTLTSRVSWMSPCCCHLPVRGHAEAVSAFVELHQQLIDCVSLGVLRVSPGGYHPAGQPHTIVLNDGDPLRLTRTPPLFVNVTLRYSITSATARRTMETIQIVEYIYSLLLSDSPRSEFLAYHWHPRGNSRAHLPHLHIRDLTLGEDSPLRRRHVLTGQVTLVEVVQMLIDEFQVRPRKTHWPLVLAEARRQLDDLG